MYSNPVSTIAILFSAVTMQVFWILAIVAAYRKEEKQTMGVLMVVFGIIFPPVAYILAWAHAEKWGIIRIMVWWSICAVVGILGVLATL